MSAASLDEEPKLSVVVPAASGGGDSLGKSPRPQVPPDGEEDEGIHSDEEEVKAMHVYKAFSNSNSTLSWYLTIL